MKVLISTYSAATNGSYGIVAREIFTRLLPMMPELELLQHGWYHYGDQYKVPWEIVPTDWVTDDPRNTGDPKDKFGSKSFHSIVQKFQPDIVWTASDPWMCDYIPQYAQYYGYKVIYYAPVDSEPYPRKWKGTYDLSHEVVAFGEYGKRVISSLSGRTDISIIPHGYDDKTFFPYEKSKKLESKIGLGDGLLDKSTFLLGWVGRDQFRKQVWVLYELMSRFIHGGYYICDSCGNCLPAEYDLVAREYSAANSHGSCSLCTGGHFRAAAPREDIKLWAHMGNRPDGAYDLNELEHQYKIEGKILYTHSLDNDTGIPASDMNVLFNTFDALLMTTGGEGFALPVIEAMACGVPSIYTDYSGHTDFAVGIPVPAQLFPEPDSMRRRAIIDMGKLIRAVLTMKDDHNLRHKLSVRAKKQAKRYTWDCRTSSWVSLFRRVMSKDTYVIGRIV